MNKITSTLNNFLVNTKATAALILNGKGKLITSLHLDYGDSIAAMSAAILSMSEKFLIDLDKGSLKQLYLKSSEGFLKRRKQELFIHVHLQELYLNSFKRFTTFCLKSTKV